MCAGYSEMRSLRFCLRLGMKIELGGERWVEGKIKYIPWALCLIIWVSGLQILGSEKLNNMPMIVQIKDDRLRIQL